MYTAKFWGTQGHLTRKTPSISYLNLACFSEFNLHTSRPHPRTFLNTPDVRHILCARMLEHSWILQVYITFCACTSLNTLKYSRCTSRFAYAHDSILSNTPGVHHIWRAPWIPYDSMVSRRVFEARILYDIFALAQWILPPCLHCSLTGKGIPLLFSTLRCFNLV